MIGFLREVVDIDELCQLCFGMIDAIEMMRVGKFSCMFMESMIREGIYCEDEVFEAMSKKFTNEMSDDFLITHALLIEWEIIAIKRPLHFTFLQKLPIEQIKICCKYTDFRLSPMTLKEIFTLYPHFGYITKNKLWTEIVYRNLSPPEIDLLIDQASIEGKRVRMLKQTQLLSDSQIALIDWWAEELSKSVDDI
jgi:hypothetical protein